MVSNTLPAPLMGAPGAVILYALIGLLVWPTDKREARSPAGGGLLGDRGGLWVWSALWAMSAALWLANVNRAKNATSEMIKSMAEASPHWLAKVQNWAVHHASGHGTTIAVVLAILSVAVAVGVWTPLRWPALWIGIVISLAYWLFGQSLGGPFWAGRRDRLQLRSAVRVAGRGPVPDPAASARRRAFGGSANSRRAPGMGVT